MKKEKGRATIFGLLALCLISLILVSCTGEFSVGGKPILKYPDYVRTPPSLLLSGYSGKIQKERKADNGIGVIDLTNLANGYVVASFTGAQKARFRIGVGDDQYTYNLNSDGEFEVYPLGMGNGKYKFTIFLHTGEGNMYEYFLETESEVMLFREQAPFTVPNQNVNYNASSLSVELSYEITKNCSSDTEVVSQIYYWVKTNLSYYQGRADNLANLSGYTPNLDEIIQSKKGICYDYAALVAAMLRINGIPCQLIKGDVQSSSSQEAVYHAWNMIWLEDRGWVAVKMPASPEEWTMVDLTFASANPVNTSDVLESYNYTQLSVH